MGCAAFAFYVSCRRLRLPSWPGVGDGGLRSWTESLLSTPLAADFGHGPEGAAGGAQLDTEFVFFAYETGCLHFLIVVRSRPLLRAWLGGDGEGAYEQRVCIPAPLAADFGPKEAWLEGLLLPLALAGPACNLKNALLRRRLRC